MSLTKELKKAFLPWKYWFQVQAKHYFTQSKMERLECGACMTITSITSYPARFKSLHLTLKTLIQQTVPADKILLWIAHEDKRQIPKNVIRLAEQSLIEICFTKDTRSYKKIIPVLKQYPDSIIITFDDDVYYSPKTLSTLLTWHKLFPTQIIANRTHEIMINDSGEILPYNLWRKNFSNQEQPERNFQTGVGGVLYPPNALNSLAVNDNLFLKLAPHGDDIWLYFMMRLQGKVAIKTDNNFELYHWPFSQKHALYKQNARQDGNDQQIKAMLNYFGSPLNMPVKDL